MRGRNALSPPSFVVKKFRATHEAAKAANIKAKAASCKAAEAARRATASATQARTKLNEIMCVLICFSFTSFNYFVHLNALLYHVADSYILYVVRGVVLQSMLMTTDFSMLRTFRFNTDCSDLVRTSIRSRPRQLIFPYVRGKCWVTLPLVIVVPLRPQKTKIALNARMSCGVKAPPPLPPMPPRRSSVRLRPRMRCSSCVAAATPPDPKTQSPFECVAAAATSDP